MPEYAYLSASTIITMSPGDVQMYRLPTMTPGEFHLYSIQQDVQQLLPPPTTPPQTSPLGTGGSPIQPVTAARTVQTGAGASAGGLRVGPALQAPPGGGGGGGGGLAAPVNLMMDLFHGTQLVASAVNSLPVEIVVSDGDSTWRVRLQIQQGAPAGSYSFNVFLNPFPSNFPVLTRRIPLAFFQQGFDNNWKGRNYVTAEFENGQLTVSIDPEVASYYGIKNYQPPTWPQFFTVNYPNVMLSDTEINMTSSATGFGLAPGPAPVVQVTASFTGVDNQPITGSVAGFSASVSDFSVTVNFYLTQVGSVPTAGVGYVSQISTDFLSKLDANWAYRDVARDLINTYGSVVQAIFDAYASKVAAAITPWLLGASFCVLNVRYDPANSQPVPAGGPQGDIVIDYIGQLPPASAVVGATQGAILSGSAPLILSPASVSSGVAGAAYSQTFNASGGVPPYTWTLSGSLPPGVTANGSALTGTPSLPGAYNIVVNVRDAANTQTSQTYTVPINSPGLSIETASELPDAVITQPYALQLAAQGSPDSQFSWAATNLPPGLSILQRGVITGTPTGASGTVYFTVQVTDSHGLTAWNVFSLTLDDPLLFSDPLYAPSGDGDTIWKPNVPAPLLPPGVPHPDQTPTTPGNLNKVDHIVLVMMENRSFDHMLGYLSREGGRTDIEGLKWETGPDRTQYNFYKGRYYYPTHLTDTQIITTEALSPDHSHQNVESQMTDGMMHFVTDYAKLKAGDDPEQLQVAMGYYTGVELPVYDMLAREYCVCDHWFCSHVGPTWPNRFVAMTGDLNRDTYGEPEVDTPDYTTFTPSEALTLFDQLTARGVSWKYFQQRESMMRAFTKYSFDMVNVLEYSDPAQGFHATAAAGQLPSFTWIDPLFGDLPAGVGSPQDNDDAPPSDLKFGQQFINDVVSTLFNRRTNPNADKTMLIIVYDEHGGFYDHVEPPDNATPLTGQFSGKLGPRVPAFVVSPYTPAGLVLKDVFDHGTIAATVLRRFCSPDPPYMGPRFAAALDLRDALPLDSPRDGLASIVNIPAGAYDPTLARTVLRRFSLPDATDSYGPFLGGIALTLGSTPGSNF